MGLLRDLLQELGLVFLHKKMLFTGLCQSVGKTVPSILNLGTGFDKISAQSMHLNYAHIL